MHGARAFDFEGDDKSYLLYLLRLDSGEALSQSIDYLERNLSGSQPIEYQHWDPESEYVSEPARRKRLSNLDPRIETFLLSLPKNEEAWLGARENSNIGTRKGLLSTFEFLFTGRIDGEPL